MNLHGCRYNNLMSCALKFFSWAEAKKNAPKNGAAQGKKNGGQTKGSNNIDQDQVHWHDSSSPFF